uniref:Uncharacterized protein n=1 Tax=viral metagenome TaxID=1070528 RepID=A0A6M3KY47_9ZZZZ
MTKRARVRYLLAAANRANTAGSTARNDAIKKVTRAYLISADITGEALARKRAVHYTGALYN